MQKIRKYVDRFFKTKKINDNYTLMLSDICALLEEMCAADVNTSWDIIETLFRYGYAKGYRAAKAEMKKVV